MQLYPASTSSSIPSATSLKIIVWSASGPNTWSKGYVFVLGPPPAPYDEAVVNEARDVEASGVVSTVICFDNGPPVVVIIGDDAASSCEDRPLYGQNVSNPPDTASRPRLRGDVLTDT